MAGVSALLTGCGGGGDAAKGNSASASGAASASAGGSSVTMQPGQYETRVQVAKFDIPGLPEAQAQAMRQAMSNTAAQTVRHCMTAEEAARGPAAMAERMAQSGQCTVDRYDVNGSAISGHVTCNTPQGRLAQSMTGTITATSSEMKVEQEISSPSLPQGKALAEMHVTSTRTGDCPAGAAAR
jgi:hypothetical protein